MKTTGRQLTQELAKLADKMRHDIEAAASGFDHAPAATTARRQAAHQDFHIFCETYFPHYLTHGPSVMHEWLFVRLQGVAERTGGRSSPSSGARLAVAAPRGEAKSTLVSQMFVLWMILTGRRFFVPVVADVYEQAARLLNGIKTELTDNPRLRQDWPEAAGEGAEWKEHAIVTRNNARIQAFGSGQSMRGLRHGPHRPDLVVADDLENDQGVRSPEQRDRLESWLNRTVLSLGPVDDSMDVVVVGTILHYDSVLSRLLRNPFWEGKTFRAVLAWPARMDLWEQWEEIWRNENEEQATAWYQTHQQEMTAGAVTSWPAHVSLHELMIKRARNRKAFDSEQQNDPVSDGDGLFGKITHWLSQPDELLFFGAVDPSLGMQGKSRDPSAILVGGWHRQSGILYVMEAAIAKRLPDLIIAEVIRLQRQWGCLLWAVEATQYQEFLRTELVKRSIQAGVRVAAKPVKPIHDKVLRIQAIQPYVADGRIRFHPGQTTLLDQLRRWPAGEHDDGPDALTMLWDATQSLVVDGPVLSTGKGTRHGVTETGFGTVRGRRDYLAGFR